MVQYVEIQIAISISESPLEFEIMRVDFTNKLRKYKINMHIYIICIECT